MLANLIATVSKPTDAYLAIARERVSAGTRRDEHPALERRGTPAQMATTVKIRRKAAP